MASLPAAEAATLSFLWYLLRNDTAFAAAILNRKQWSERSPTYASTGE
jgi:hypothetical protein